MDENGGPIFSVLHRQDEAGRSLLGPHGEVPAMHSFRHTVASRALLAGESVDEIAFLLGHRDANVTRAIYVRELARCSSTHDAPLPDDRRVRRLVEAVDGGGLSPSPTIITADRS
ncbi:MAG: tyrosine-type recombinase/integrase [Solirubrobacterales bacterium]|nr:tyrosine-type recombinase/integrase [Solirubrobacterales bacterium]MBV9799968.1 tyrosine-type recombinase/integrase [Solirubrobacterales bacterium]